MSLRIFRHDAWRLSIYFNTLYGICSTLSTEDYRRKNLLNSMNRIVTLYADNPGNAAEASKIATKKSQYKAPLAIQRTKHI